MNFQHSKLGIASFVLSCMCVLAAFTLFAVCLVVKTIEHVDRDVVQVAQVLFLLAFFSLLAANFAALALGIASFVRSPRKKTFAGLGVAIAGLQLMLGVVVIIAMINSH